jgi:rsbT co-antagonist protein RsbR
MLMGDLSNPGDSPLVVVGFDPDLRVTVWNRRAELVFGTDATSAIGRSLADLLPLAGDASWRTAIDAAGDPAPRVWSIRRPDAAWSLEAWSQLERDGAGRVTAVTMYGHDATARQTELADLKLKATLLKAIEDNLEVALWAIDKDALFLYQDGKAIRSAGLTPHQFVGLNIFDIYRDSSATVTDSVRRALAGESLRTIGEEQHGLIWDTWFIPLADHPTAQAPPARITPHSRPPDPLRRQSVTRSSTDGRTSGAPAQTGQGRPAPTVTGKWSDE